MYEATMLLITVAGIHLMALVTPGPDLFLITQVAVSHTRRDAMMAVIGITLGVAVWAIVALLGLHVLVERLPWIQTMLYFAGGGYLSYLGIILLRASIRQLKRSHIRANDDSTDVLGEGNLALGESENKSENKSSAKAGYQFLLNGLFTNLANPKALIYFGSVFVIFVGGQVSNIVRGEIFTLVVIETFLWFTLVTILFSLPKPKAVYLKAGAYIDGTAGIFFLGFGVSLIYQAIMQVIN